MKHLGILGLAGLLGMYFFADKISAAGTGGAVLTGAVVLVLIQGIVLLRD
jgi:hypothetical protein